MSGGGDDFGRQQARNEAKKQQARDALNLQFGVAPNGGPPTREQFTKSKQTFVPAGSEESSQVRLSDPVFDEQAFNDALAAWNQQAADAEKNKAAREALYTGARENAFTAGKRRLDDSRGKAMRDNKFALFGQGLNGGSVDIDENALLGRTYNEGTLDLGAKADGTAANLRGDDEATRLGLLQSIDAGMDQSSALSSSLAQLQVNSDKATAAAQGTTLGDLFADAGLLYTKSQAGRGRTDEQMRWATGNPYNSSKRGSTAPTGIISSTG